MSNQELLSSNVEIDCWNQWKLKCAVFRCDDQTQEYLSREIWGKFYWFSKSIGLVPPSMKDAITEFDSYLIEREYGEGGREPKRWKNVIWKAMEESKDPPMKIINGKLLGRHGVLWNVVRRWRRVNFTESISIDKEGIKEIEDQSVQDHAYEVREEFEAIQMLLMNLLDYREKIALLALWFKVSLDDFCVKEAMQIGKDACYRAKASLCEKLRKMKSENEIIRDPSFMTLFVMHLKKQLASENCAKALLNKLEENSQNW